MTAAARLAVDIGGTFTDLAVESEGGERWTAKVLTTPAAPERGVLEGVRPSVAKMLTHAGSRWSDVNCRDGLWSLR